MEPLAGPLSPDSLATDVGRSEHLRSVFAALASAPRLDILHALVGAQSCHVRSGISDIARQTELSRFSASHHLDILRRAGLVSGYREGSRSFHTLNGRTFEYIEDWLYPVLEVCES